MRFSLITVALCAAVLSPVATFGHEGHHHDDDATNSTIMDPEVSAIVISIDGDAFTYLVPQASVSLGSHTITDSGSPVSTGLAHFNNQSSIYVSPIEDISSIYVAPVEDISGIYADPIGDISGIYVGPVEDISSIYVGPVEGVSGIYDDPIEDISSIYVGPVEDISSIYVGPVEDISSIYVGPIEAISTERAGRSNSSTDGFTTYTLSLSTGTNRTGSPMDPTATDDSAAPTDVTGIAVRTTPAAAAMVAFIAAGLAVLEL